MFHSIKLKKIDFKSNPSIPPRFEVAQVINESGDPVPQVQLVQQDNKGILFSSHFDPVSMSLRARLNRGVALQRVGYDVTENDPNKLYASAKRMSSQLSSKSAAHKSSISPSSEGSDS